MLFWKVPRNREGAQPSKKKPKSWIRKRFHVRDIKHGGSSLFRFLVPFFADATLLEGFKMKVCFLTNRFFLLTQQASLNEQALYFVMVMAKVRPVVCVF